MGPLIDVNDIGEYSPLFGALWCWVNQAPSSVGTMLSKS